VDNKILTMILSFLLLSCAEDRGTAGKPGEKKNAGSTRVPGAKTEDASVDVKGLGKTAKTCIPSTEFQGKINSNIEFKAKCAIGTFKPDQKNIMNNQIGIEHETLGRDAAIVPIYFGEDRTNPPSIVAGKVYAVGAESTTRMPEGWMIGFQYHAYKDDVVSIENDITCEGVGTVKYNKVANKVGDPIEAEFDIKYMNCTDPTSPSKKVRKDWSMKGNVKINKAKEPTVEGIGRTLTQ